MILLALAMMTAPAAQTTQATAVPPPATPPAKEKPICRREIPVGSIMPVRTCHSKAEWAMIDRANNDAAETARRSNAAHSSAMPSN